MTNKRTEILTEAAELVNGSRNTEYGPPETNFAKIATGWSVILGVDVSAEQVSLCMAWLKIARIIAGEGQASRDSFTDAAAYMALAGELADV